MSKWLSRKKPALSQDSKRFPIFYLTQSLRCGIIYLMKTPDLNKPVFQLFPHMVEQVTNHECVTCDNQITDDGFRDEISVKEYGISGMCQQCQDSVFCNSDEE